MSEKRLVYLINILFDEQFETLPEIMSGFKDTRKLLVGPSWWIALSSSCRLNSSLILVWHKCREYKSSYDKSTLWQNMRTFTLQNMHVFGNIFPKERLASVKCAICCIWEQKIIGNIQQIGHNSWCEDQLRRKDDLFWCFRHFLRFGKICGVIPFDGVLTGGLDDLKLR